MKDGNPVCPECGDDLQLETYEKSSTHDNMIAVEYTTYHCPGCNEDIDSDDVVWEL
jgi:uncharacterized protein (UPF0212 family)